MKIAQEIFEISTDRQGLYEFTDQAVRMVKAAGVEQGQLTLFCQHTSCSLIIQENADPDVQRDLLEFFKRLVPENMDWVRHTMEGPDDMPAHIKGAMMATSLTIPIGQGKAMLGVWQGIYLFEHRVHPHRRQVVAQVIGI